MLPFGIGFSEVLIILVVLLLVVGPGKLPDIARTLGKGVRAARRAGQELRDAIEYDDLRRDIRRAVYDEPRRPWEHAAKVDDAEPDAGGTYIAKAAPPGDHDAPDGAEAPAAPSAVVAATAAAADIEDAHLIDEADEAGPVSRGPSAASVARAATPPPEEKA